MNCPRASLRIAILTGLSAWLLRLRERRPLPSTDVEPAVRRRWFARPRKFRSASDSPGSSGRDATAWSNELADVSVRTDDDEGRCAPSLLAKGTRVGCDFLAASAGTAGAEDNRTVK